jgi:methyl-accepting chemotaxis protein
MTVKTWDNLSLRIKIIIGLVVVSLVGVGTVAATGLVQLREINALATRTYEDSARSLAAGGTARAEVASTEMVVHELMVALATDDDTAGMADEVIAHLDGARTAIEGIDVPGLAADRERFLTAWASYDAAIRDKVLPLLREGDVKGAGKAMFDGSDAHFDEATTAVAELSDHAAEIGRTDSEHASAQYRSTVRQMLLISGLVLLLVVGAAVVISRKISRPIRAAVDALSRVADGDLTQRVSIQSNDELGRLGTALNRTVEATGASVRRVQRSCEALTAAAAELSALSDDLASSAEQTRGQAVSIGAAAEQVTSSTAQAAGGAEEASTAVSEIAVNGAQAAASAAAAVTQVHDTAELVGSLQDSSTAITEIVKVINAVAEQTNLLALNATIEAARAGELGKGFSVVAAEVKDLARQTATATGDISAKIEGIRADAGRAAEAIASISEVVEQVDRMQATVSAAVEEHTATAGEMTRSMNQAATGSAQISQTIADMAAAAGHTAENAGTVRSAATQLDRLAEELAASIAHFHAEAERSEF